MKQLNDTWFEWLDFSSVNLLLGLMLLFSVIGLFALYIHDNNKHRFNVEIKLVAGKTKYVLLYSLLGALLLILPITSVLLIKTKTVFYNYSVLWIGIPIIQIAATFLVVIFNYFTTMKKLQCFATTVLTCMLLLLCGSMGTGKNGDTWFFVNWRGNVNPVTTHDERYDEVIPLFDVLTAETDDLTILAPPNVTEYAHYYSGNIKTLYGKDMWDGPATSFVYEQYDEDIKNLYKWMFYESEYGCVYYYNEDYSKSILDDFNYSNLDYPSMDKDEKYTGGIEFIQQAKENGVDAIVFYVRDGRTDIKGIYYIVDTLELGSQYVPIVGKIGEGYMVVKL